MASSRKSNSRRTACRASTLSDRISAQLATLIPAHSTILIGLSGGVDSVVLLHLLSRLAPHHDWRLTALHVHHGISPHADDWAGFCAELCASQTIPLHIERVDITPLRAHGIEAAARKLRYAAFAGQRCDFVALAHHADDQAETLMLQLLRGAGVRGAAAMPFVSMPSAEMGHRMLRPLLDISRATLLEYATLHGLRWVEDESNADNSYPRNFLRHRVLPLLEDRFPACRDTLARSARNFAEASELLDDLAQLDAEAAILGDALSVAVLRELTPPRAKNLLRHFLHAQGASTPQAAQLDDMLHQLCDARQDAAVCVEYGGRWQLRRYQERAYVSPVLPEFDRDMVALWHGEAELAWPALGCDLRFDVAQGSGISLAKLQSAPVTLRLRNGGEALRPHLRAATRSLKHLLQEHAVPPWRRERLPLVYCGDELVCVVGVAVAAEYQADANEAGMRVDFS